MSAEPAAKEGEEEPAAQLSSGRLIVPLRPILRWVLAAALGAGGGAAERRLTPAPDSLEHANALVELRLRVQVLEQRAGEDRGRIGKLEDQVRPASYAPR